MLLYKTTHKQDKPEERTQTITVVSFQGSQTESSKARSALKAQGFKPETQTIEVPINKSGLLEWLNANVTS